MPHDSWGTAEKFLERIPFFCCKNGLAAGQGSGAPGFSRACARCWPLCIRLRSRPRWCRCWRSRRAVGRIVRGCAVRCKVWRLPNMISGQGCGLLPFWGSVACLSVWFGLGFTRSIGCHSTLSLTHKRVNNNRSPQMHVWVVRRYFNAPRLSQ